MSIMPIDRIQPPRPIAGPQAAQPAQKTIGDFQQMIAGAAQDVDALQSQAGAEVANLAAGKTDNVHQVMLALGKSELSFNYMLEVRNRVIDAYKEIMRMSV